MLPNHEVELCVTNPPPHILAPSIPVSSSLPIKQVKLPQLPVKIPILVSKLAPQRSAVIMPPIPCTVYHTPGAVLRSVVQVPGLPVLVAPTVVPGVTEFAPTMIAFAQSLLTGGAGGVPMQISNVVLELELVHVSTLTK